MLNLSFTKNQKIIFPIYFIFGVFCLAYLTKGFYHLVLDKEAAGDLYQRWLEQQYIYRGIFPYNVTENSGLVNSTLGAIGSGGYPPWAFFSGFVFLPPINFELTRWYHAFLNLVSLTILALFAYQIGKPYGKLRAWFTVLACLSISSNCTTLGLGQYGLIVNALLIGAFWLFKKNHDLSAGLLLGISLLKPNISALYFLVPIIRKNIRAIFTCSLYLVAASSIVGFVTHTSPLYMLSKIVTGARNLPHSEYSAVGIMKSLGVSPFAATISLAAVGVCAVIGIFYLFKNHSLIFLFAIDAVIGRLWTYHLIYDNVMLVFLLLAIIDLTFKKPTKINAIVLILLLLTLSSPAKITDLPFAPMVSSIIWIGAVVHLISSQKQFQEFKNLATPR
jgi:Glycosyltransferase family 87